MPGHPGFWHKASHWLNVGADVHIDGVIYNHSNHSMAIGGVTHTRK